MIYNLVLCCAGSGSLVSFRTTTKKNPGGVGDELLPHTRHVDPQAHPNFDRRLAGHVRAPPAEREGHSVRPRHDPYGGGDHMPGRRRVRRVLLSAQQEVGQRL